MLILPSDAMTAEFADRLGRYLRAVRRERRLRLRQLATDDLPKATLRALEKGTHPLTPLVVAEVAARYGAELAELLPAREPLVLLATGTICGGGLEESFEPGDIDSLIDAYLHLVRRLRGVECPVTSLRREDLVSIADQAGRPRTDIVDRVAAAMGATTAQRRAMVELYLAGADVVGVTV